MLSPDELLLPAYLHSFEVCVQLQTWPPPLHNLKFGENAIQGCMGVGLHVFQKIAGVTYPNDIYSLPYILLVTYSSTFLFLIRSELKPEISASLLVCILGDRQKRKHTQSLCNSSWHLNNILRLCFLAFTDVLLLTPADVCFWCLRSMMILYQFFSLPLAEQTTA